MADFSNKVIYQISLQAFVVGVICIILNLKGVFEKY